MEIDMKAILKMIDSMGRAFTISRAGVNLKESLKMVWVKDLGHIHIQTGLNILDHTIMIRNMEKSLI